MPRRRVFCTVCLLLLAWLLGRLGSTLLPAQANSGPEVLLLQGTTIQEQQEGPPTPTPLPIEYRTPQSHPAMIIGIVVLVLIILLGVARFPRRG